MLKNPFSAHSEQLERCLNQTLPVKYFFADQHILQHASPPFGGQGSTMSYHLAMMPPRRNCPQKITAKPEEIPENLVAEAQALTNGAKGPWPLAARS